MAMNIFSNVFNIRPNIYGKPKFFVMLMHGRTGSSLLTEYIDSHPEAVMFGEQIVKYKKEKRADKQEKWIRVRFEKRYPKNIKAVGFKTKIQDILDLDNFYNMLREYDVSVIHSERKNLIKLTVSSLNSLRLFKNTNKWNSYKRKDIPIATVFDIKEFDEMLNKKIKHQKELDEFIKKLDKPTLKIFYEDILTNKSRVMNEICGFLGIDPEKEMKTDMIKTTNDSLKHVIKNYEEISEHFEGSVYHDMLEEILVD